MNQPLKLKVCGMREEQNIRDLLALHPDFMGFIFFEKSPRNVGDSLPTELLLSFPKTIHKVGVFVNATVDFIKDNIEKYRFDGVQLHGKESPDYCDTLRSTVKHIQIIKAFSIDNTFDFSQLKSYEKSCDYFLFDTKGKNPGGNGEKFNWDLLKTSHVNKPFFLSGGIDGEDIELVLKTASSFKNLYALDINSKFEISPALKDIPKIKTFKSALDASNRTK